MTGDFICLRWDDKAARYQRITDHPLIDGKGGRNAYIDTNAPILGLDGAWHMVWVWRDSPDAESTHTVNYARSTNLVNWSGADGSPVCHPIVDDVATVVDPVPPGHGLINNNVRLGFLPSGSPLVVYHKRDDAGSQQIWVAIVVGAQWMSRQLTAWDFKWDFAGRGSLDFQIEIGPPSTTASGFRVDVRRHEDVEVYFVNEKLSVTSLSSASPWNPLRRVLRSDGLHERVTLGRGWAPSDVGDDWLVLHSSLLERRDRRPVEPAPASQPLVVVGTARPTVPDVGH